MNKHDNEIERITPQRAENLTQADKDFLARLCDDAKQEFPLVDVPASLSTSLYAITQEKQVEKTSWGRWTPALASAAAAAVIAGVITFSHFAASPSEQEILRAKQELAIAFGYLNAANEKANAHVRHTVYKKLQRAALVPVMAVVADEYQEL